MKINKSTKIEAIAARQPGRYEMQHCKLECGRNAAGDAHPNAGVLVATDSHRLAVLNVEIEAGDIDGFVTVDAIKAARKAAPKGRMNEFTLCSLHANGALAIDNGPTFARPTEGEFPRWSAVTSLAPTRGSDGSHTVTFNADYLAELQSALGSESVTITFIPDADGRVTKPIRVNVPMDTNGFGVLMPITVDG